MHWLPVSNITRTNHPRLVNLIYAVACGRGGVDWDGMLRGIGMFVFIYFFDFASLFDIVCFDSFVCICGGRSDFAFFSVDYFLLTIKTSCIYNNWNQK